MQLFPFGYKNKSIDVTFQIMALIDCLVFNPFATLFEFETSAPTYGSLELFFYHFSAQYSLHRLLSHITTVQTMDSGERGMNPIAITHHSSERAWAELRVRSNLMFSSHVRQTLSYRARFEVMASMIM